MPGIYSSLNDSLRGVVFHRVSVHMAQLEFPGVPIGIKGNRRRKLLNPSETARNIRARSWMADIESAKPIEINTIAARARASERARDRLVYVFAARRDRVTHAEIDFSDSVSRVLRPLRHLDSQTIRPRRASPDLNESLARRFPLKGTRPWILTWWVRVYKYTI